MEDGLDLRHVVHEPGVARELLWKGRVTVRDGRLSVGHLLTAVVTNAFQEAHKKRLRKSIM